MGKVIGFKGEDSILEKSTGLVPYDAMCQCPRNPKHRGRAVLRLYSYPGRTQDGTTAKRNGGQGRASDSR